MLLSPVVAGARDYDRDRDFDRHRHREHGYREHHYRDWDRVESAVQRELRDRGYYHGPADGNIGPRTRAAIRAYQARHGMDVNGRITPSLLRSLGLS